MAAPGQPTDVEELLALARAEIKRVERHARISKQLIARAEAAAVANNTVQEDTENGNSHEVSQQV